MSQPTSERAVTVKELVEDDRRLQATVVFSRRMSAQLKRVGGDLQLALAKAVRSAVTDLKEQPKRIVAHVPQSLVARFEEYCHGSGTNTSRALLGRISRYVDEDGEILKLNYSNKQRIPASVWGEKTKMSRL